MLQMDPHRPLVLIVLVGKEIVKCSISIDNYSNYEYECNVTNVAGVLTKSISHLLASYENPNICIVLNGTINLTIIDNCKKYVVAGIDNVGEVKEFFYMNYKLFANINLGETKTIKLVSRRKRINIHRAG